RPCALRWRRTEWCRNPKSRRNLETSTSRICPLTRARRAYDNQVVSPESEGVDMILLRSLRGMWAFVLGWLIMGTAASFAKAPAVWPQWRGPTRDGHVTGADWPASLQGDALE